MMPASTTIILFPEGPVLSGSHLVERLVSLGCRVRVLDDFSTGKEENIAHLADRVEIIRGDIRDKKLCRKAAEGMEVILHQAALTSVPRSVAEPLLAHEINLTGTLNLLLAAAPNRGQEFCLCFFICRLRRRPDFSQKRGPGGKSAFSVRRSETGGRKITVRFSASSIILAPSACATLTCSAPGRTRLPSMPQSFQSSSPGCSRASHQ